MATNSAVITCFLEKDIFLRFDIILNMFCVKYLWFVYELSNLKGWKANG